MGARTILARATTIAIRYCAVRRQFRPRGKDAALDETAVLDYPTVQIRLFPLLATTFALHYTGKMMGLIYDRTRLDVETKADLSGLDDLHALSSGLKSLSTELATEGMETCRRAMGGHGYGGASGLVSMNADYLSKPTVEGDNWMITQQMARYLLKKAKLIATESATAVSSRTEAKLKRYWEDTKGRNGSELGTPFDVLKTDDALVDAFDHRAAFLVSHEATFLLPWVTAKY